MAAASALERMLPDVHGSQGAAVIFVLRGRETVDGTMIGVLRRYAEHLHRLVGVSLLVEVSEHVLEQLERTKLLKLLARKNVVLGEEKVGSARNKAPVTAEGWLSMSWGTAQVTHRIEGNEPEENIAMGEEIGE